jgi:chitinase
MRNWWSALMALVYFAVLGAGAIQASEGERLPRFIVYYNADVTPADEIVGTGYTHVILSFVTLDAKSGNPGALVVPASMEKPLAAVKKLQADGKRVLISFGGGDMLTEDWRLAVGHETETAAALARFVTRHGLDGVDIDFEISPALEQGSHSMPFDGVKFLIALTRALKASLPKSATISHAPQPPYLSPNWFGGPYLAVMKAVGEDIDGSSTL